MNVKQDTFKSNEHTPCHHVFPANTSALLTLIGIIVSAFLVSIMALFSY